jgi:hypothetical protein
VTHLEPRDNGYYWYDSGSDCDLFGPFDSVDDANTAARLGILDQLALNRHRERSR